MPMSGFELGSSGIGTERSTKCTTTACLHAWSALKKCQLVKLVSCFLLLLKRWGSENSLHQCDQTC